MKYVQRNGSHGNNYGQLGTWHDPGEVCNVVTNLDHGRRDHDEKFV